MAQGLLSRLLGRGSSRASRSDIELAILQTTDSNPEARRSAALRLGKYGEESDRVMEALQKLRTDEVREVRHAADWALRQFARES